MRIEKKGNFWRDEALAGRFWLFENDPITGDIKNNNETPVVSKVARTTEVNMTSQGGFLVSKFEAYKASFIEYFYRNLISGIPKAFKNMISKSSKAKSN